MSPKTKQRAKMTINDPLERLSLFCERAKELRERRQRLGGGSIKLSIRWNNENGMQLTSQEPNDECLRSFLITFRQFLSDNEPIFIFGIYNLCQQYMTNDTYKGYLNKSREILKKHFRQSGLPVVRDGHKISAKHIWDVFINGIIFHSSAKEKMEEARNLLPHEKPFFRFNFLNLILDVTDQINYTEKIIRAALNEGSIVIPNKK